MQVLIKSVNNSDFLLFINFLSYINKTQKGAKNMEYTMRNAFKKWLILHNEEYVFIDM